MIEIMKIIGEYGGLNAIISLGLAWACYKLWQHNSKQQEIFLKHINEQQAQIVQLQEVRVQEAVAVRGELMKFSEESNKALSGMSSALTTLKDAVFQNIKD